MNDRRSDYPKRQLIPFDVMSQGPECALVCVDKRGIWGLLALTERMRWRTSWYKELVEGGYTIPLEVEFDSVLDLVDDVRDSLIEGLTMNCNDLINITVEGGCGCGDCGGKGVRGSEPTDIFGGINPDVPPVDLTDPTTLPDGFNGNPQIFKDNKCKVANAIVEQLRSFLTDMKAVAVAADVADFALALVPISAKMRPRFAILLAIASAAFAVLDVLEPAIDWLDNELVSRRDAIVCALYQSASTSDARAAINEQINAILGGATAVKYGILGNAVLGLLTENGNINRLFEPAGVILPSPNTPCSDCDVICPPYQTVVGTSIENASVIVTSSQEVIDVGVAYQVVQIALGFPDGVRDNQNACSDPPAFEFNSGTAGLVLNDGLAGNTEVRFGSNPVYAGRQQPYNDNIWQQRFGTFPPPGVYAGVRSIVFVNRGANFQVAWRYDGYGGVGV